MRLGDKQGAAADFRKALQIDPNQSSARSGLQHLGVTL